MDLTTKNKISVLSRWRKVQLAELQYIESNAGKHSNLRARILGFLAGDGNIYIGQSNGHHSIRFFPDHYSLLNPFCEAMGKVYGKMPLIYRRPNMYCLTVDSKMIVQDLIKQTQFGVGNWRIPIDLLSENESKVEWLRAFFDCEAYVSKRAIRIQTINEIGMNQLKELLEYSDIYSKRYLYIPKNKNWNANHILVINNKNKIKYLNKIGFNHSVKLKKLKDTLKIYK